MIVHGRCLDIAMLTPPLIYHVRSTSCCIVSGLYGLSEPKYHKYGYMYISDRSRTPKGMYAMWSRAPQANVSFGWVEHCCATLSNQHWCQNPGACATGRFFCTRLHVVQKSVKIVRFDENWMKNTDKRDPFVWGYNPLFSSKHVKFWLPLISEIMYSAQTQ